MSTWALAVAMVGLPVDVTKYSMYPNWHICEQYHKRAYEDLWITKGLVNSTFCQRERCASFGGTCIWVNDERFNNQYNTYRQYEEYFRMKADFWWACWWVADPKATADDRARWDRVARDLMADDAYFDSGLWWREYP